MYKNKTNNKLHVSVYGITGLVYSYPWNAFISNIWNICFHFQHLEHMLSFSTFGTYTFIFNIWNICFHFQHLAVRWLSELGNWIT